MVADSKFTEHPPRPDDKKEVVSLVTTKSDAERAAELKKKLLDHVTPMLEVFDEASAAGLIIQWDSIAPGPPFYKHQVHGLRIVKHF